MKQKPWAERAERSSQGTFQATGEPRKIPLNIRIPERVNGLLQKIQNGSGSRTDAAIAAIEVAGTLHDVLEQCPDLEWAEKTLRDALEAKASG